LRTVGDILVELLTLDESSSMLRQRSHRESEKHGFVWVWDMLMKLYWFVGGKVLEERS